MRFNTADEVRVAAERAGAGDWFACINHVVDLNPYCTQEARNCWERGFVGVAKSPHGFNSDWDFQYQRGAAAQRIVQRALCTD